VLPYNRALHAGHQRSTGSNQNTSISSFGMGAKQIKNSTELSIVGLEDFQNAPA
jgi:hypothetical protein